MRWWLWWGGGNPPATSHPSTNTCAHNHTHNENTTDNLKTWWDFRAQWKVWMTVGGEAAQPVLDWHPVAVSVHSVGGNKAQCHGNHIKSTLKLIYLQKQWKLCWYSPFFALGVCFYDPMSISVRILLGKKQKNNQVRVITLWNIHN